MEWLKDHEPEEVLPAPFNNFTQKQLFWISSAQYKCSHLTDQERKNQLTSSDYAPWEIRNIGSVMSSPEFSADFNCPIGSPMNPDWSAVEGCGAAGKKELTLFLIELRSWIVNYR